MRYDTKENVTRAEKYTRSQLCEGVGGFNPFAQNGRPSQSQWGSYEN